MESAGAMSKELRNWTEVGDLYRRASELYIDMLLQREPGKHFICILLIFFLLSNQIGINIYLKFHDMKASID